MKTFFDKRTCAGEGGELERALDDVFGIWVTVRSCCKKRIETKLSKSKKVRMKVTRRRKKTSQWIILKRIN